MKRRLLLLFLKRSSFCFIVALRAAAVAAGLRWGEQCVCRTRWTGCRSEPVLLLRTTAAPFTELFSRGSLKNQPDLVLKVRSVGGGRGGARGPHRRRFCRKFIGLWWRFLGESAGFRGMPKNREVAEIFSPAAGLLWVRQAGCAEGSGVSQSSGGLLEVPPWLLEVFISTLSRFRCVQVGDDQRCSRRTCWSFRGRFLCSDLITSEGPRLRFWRR